MSRSSLGLVAATLVHLVVMSGVGLLSYITAWDPDGGMMRRLASDGLAMVFELLALPASLLWRFDLPTFGDIPLWDGTARDYFRGLPDLPLFVGNSILWALLFRRLWRSAHRSVGTGAGA